MGMVRIAYLHATYGYYLAYKHLREALAKIADVKFYVVPKPLNENDSPLWNAKDIVKEFDPDAIVIGVNNTVHRSIFNLEKVKCLKIMFSDDPHNWLERKAKFMNKAKIDIMLMMNYGKYYGKPENYPHWWLHPYKLYPESSPRPPEIYGGRMSIADKYQRQLKYKCKFIFFPESVNINFFKDYGFPRTCDVFNSGSHSLTVYPLRSKIYRTLSRRPDINCCIHPRFAFNNWLNYAKAIANSKILITGLGLFHYTSARFTQAMASKTLVLAPQPFDSLDNHFIPDETFVEINENDFVEKVLYYLENETERNRIIHNAYKAVLKYHTCEIRSKELLNIIKEAMKWKE